MSGSPVNSSDFPCYFPAGRMVSLLVTKAALSTGNSLLLFEPFSSSSLGEGWVQELPRGDAALGGGCRSWLLLSFSSFGGVEGTVRGAC